MGGGGGVHSWVNFCWVCATGLSVHLPHYRAILWPNIDSILSVLTRILPWGVPGPPLLRNRGPVRTLGGQSYKKHALRRTWARTPNCLLHEVPTWSNMAEEVFTIQRRSLWCSGTCVGPMKVKATKLKTLTHLISCFLFIQTNRML